MTNLNQRAIQILLIEDNEADVILTSRAFTQSKVKNQIHVAKNAEMALEMAKKSGEYAKSPSFDLILLDINLPGKNGFDVLKELKADKKTHDIPIIMLSGSSSNTDIEKCYDLQASSYITKPKTREEFNEIVQAVEMCWFRGITRLHEAKARAKNHYTVRTLSSMIKTG